MKRTETHFHFQNYLSLESWSVMVPVHSCQISAFQDFYFMNKTIRNSKVLLSKPVALYSQQQIIQAILKDMDAW